MNAKTGLPEGALRGDGGLTKRNLNHLPAEENLGTASVRSVASSNVRPKDETPEERRLRKQTVKMERRVSHFLAGIASLDVHMICS